MTTKTFTNLRLSALLTACLGSLFGCSQEADVVLYCALDQIHSEELVREFEQETGLKVRAEFDIEQHKTVGLVRRLREEKNRPRCDVFWNNEIANTVALAEEGLLASYDSPSAAEIPAQFRDSQNRWTGFAARARVFIVNTDLVPDPSQIKGMWDIVDPRWAGRVGMAKPLTGTTLTHFTALFEVLGEDIAARYLSELKSADISWTRGNAHLMRQVSEGNLAWGWTDTDDYNVALTNGSPVAVVYPDQGQDDQPGLGTMVIPNSVAVLSYAPHPDNARRLVDFILSKRVEEKLAASRSAQIPVRADVPRPDSVKGASDFQVMQVDFDKVGKRINERLESFNNYFNQ